MGKTKDLSAFEQGMVEGAWRIGLCQDFNTARLFLRSTVSRVYQEWSTTQRTSIPLYTTVQLNILNF
jgi:hypothetical protein